ncbi:MULTISPECIES: GAF domain-containing serine/threonine-protein kinase [Arthrobacter]|uniref:GAF domain-containing serine/threonine-protein kinase n=1 Tax=Arthrobacter TaxID=1663 RepID=UPI000971B676|nr:MULTISPECIES: GAF domain-containing serine/threonine-protein kinase [Arthrobacter]APX01076.1 serine/threonine protein kinase [Arthrobacter sp. QXT-31]
MAVESGSAEGAILGGRYRMVEQIGSGAMANVYRAVDESLEREVAIKVINRRDTTRETARDDDAEVKVLAALNHHSLITLLDAGVDRQGPGRPRIYLVMELVEGPDLKRRLTEGPLSPRHTAEIGYDVADALAYIHESGVVHRDVKPGNILVFDYQHDTARMHAKLTDFGIALMADEPDLQGEGFLGTAGYLSPEQAKAEPVGPPSDVYSLGLVLLECLTGQQAFPGDPLQSALARLMNDPHIPDDIEPEWRLLLSAMTARNPEDRPSTTEVSQALYELSLSTRGKHKVDASVIPADEEARMEAVRSYGILDTPPDGAFDRVTALAARLFSVPVAIVSIVDHDRIWFKSHYGLEVKQISRDPGLCASAILQDDLWVVENAPEDPRTLLNPLVAGEFGLKFYAGVPLKTRSGHNLGTLCILDFEPRTLTAEDHANLRDLAGMVMTDLELRLEAAAGQPDTPLGSAASTIPMDTGLVS